MLSLRNTVLAAALVGLAVSTVAIADSRSPRSGYLGSASCKACHEAEYRAWKATAHARAGARLRGQKAPAACSGCHSTGQVARPVEAAVGCEACHGPGGGYSPGDIMKNPILSRALGLRELGTQELREALCLECHQESTRLRPFRYDLAWSRIRHGVVASPGKAR